MLKNRASRALRRKHRARTALSAKTTRAYRMNKASEPDRELAAKRLAKQQRWARIARSRIKIVPKKPFYIGGESEAA